MKNLSEILKKSFKVRKIHLLKIKNFCVLRMHSECEECRWTSHRLDVSLRRRVHTECNYHKKRISTIVWWSCCKSRGTWWQMKDLDLIWKSLGWARKLQCLYWEEPGWFPPCIVCWLLGGLDCWVTTSRGLAEWITQSLGHQGGGKDLTYQSCCTFA